MNSESVLLAFLLTSVAGLATVIGSVMAFFSRKFNPLFLSGSLGFSAGVMIYISFVELFPQARQTLTLIHGVSVGGWLTVAAFFSGIALIALIDKLVPSAENPHEMANLDSARFSEKESSARLKRVGVFTALAIGIHNFPEGIATFAGSLNDPALGVSIAVAIAIHNIPEGIAVSVPVYFATKSRRKAFWLSLLSGLAEPVGALVAFLIFGSLLDQTAFGFVFAAVAGIMVYISLDELLPAAEEYGQHHIAIGGLIAGMLVMSVSLLLLG